MEPDRLGRRVWALFTPYRLSLVAIVVAGVVSRGFGIITPFLTPGAFDRALVPLVGGGGGPGVVGGVLAALVAMVLLSWQLTLVAVALIPLFVMLQVRVGRVRRKLAGRTQESLSEMTALTQESLSISGVLLAKVFNRQAYELARYRAENARQVELQVRQAMTGQSFFAVVQTFLGVTPALVYLVAGYLIAAGGGVTVTAGTIVAFTTLQTRLLFPTVNLLRVSLDVQTSLALFARIFGYLDLTPRIVHGPHARVLDTTNP